VTRLGIAFTGQPHSVREIVSAAVEAEAAGFDSVWIAEDYWTGRDGIATLACVAYATRRIRIGTCVVNPYTRHPVLLAMTINAIHELAPDRLVVGIGAGGSWWPIVPPTSRVSPLRTLRQTLDLMRALFAGESAPWDGGAITLEPTFSFMVGTVSPPRSRIPLYVGARGPRMLALAARYGDGLLLGLNTRPDQAQERIRLFRTGSDAARRAGARETVKLILTSPTSTGNGYVNAMRYVARVVSGLDAETVSALGFPPKTIAEMAALFAAGMYDHAARLLTPAMISQHGAIGDHTSCSATLDAFTSADVDTLVLTSLGAEIGPLIDFGRSYMN
jgi:5,10-methylenetetrahydromethanopterin reductase